MSDQLELNHHQILTENFHIRNVFSKMVNPLENIAKDPNFFTKMTPSKTRSVKRKTTDQKKNTNEQIKDKVNTDLGQIREASTSNQ